VRIWRVIPSLICAKDTICYSVAGEDGVYRYMTEAIPSEICVDARGDFSDKAASVWLERNSDV
jgi:hypothetical protein